jgi:site-specific recombinase XerD
VPSHDSSGLHASYLDYLTRTGRGNTAYWTAARSFFARWPDPAAWAAEPLPVRLAANGSTRPLITFLILHGGLRPGYDYLLERKFSSIWREAEGCHVGAGLALFLRTAEQLGFAERVRIATASQVPARLLIQTGRPLHLLTDQDIDAFTDACIERAQRTGKGWRHYEAAVSTTRRVLFHLQVLSAPKATASAIAFADRLRVATPPVKAALVAYLERKRATCAPKTVSCLATRLKHFGVFLAHIDPALPSIADLQRCRHIEPYLSAQVDAVNTKSNQTITVAERARRVLALAGFLTDITEWGWPDAPARRLVFRDDIPKLPRILPRYLPVDADRRLTEQLQHPGTGNELAACALRLQRACGLRIGELLDLELDCVHEVPGQGAWLKVPLGKLESERMVPLDEEILDLIDHIIAIRSPGQPLPHPRYRRQAQFLFTHHGRRLSQNAVREELERG